MYMYRYTGEYVVEILGEGARAVEGGDEVEGI